MNNQEEKTFGQGAVANIGPFDSSDICPSGNDPARLQEIGGLNFGAFLLWPFWLWTIRPMWAIVAFFSPFFTCGLGSVFSAFFVLIKGNRLAWKFRRFNDVEEFRAVQGAWFKWGLIFIGLSIALWVGVMVFSVVIAMISGGGSSS